MAAREVLDLCTRMAHVDLERPSLPDLFHKHMQNSQSSISLVRSNGKYLISQSVNLGVTCDGLWTFESRSKGGNEEEGGARIVGIVAHFFHATWPHLSCLIL